MSSQRRKLSFFHRPDQNPSDLISEAVLENRITEIDADLIQTYVSEYAISRNVKNAGLVQITRLLISMRKICNAYIGATITDFYAIINEIKSGKSQRGTPYGTATQNLYIIVMKVFFAWLIENGYSEIPLKKLNSVKPPGLPPSKISASDLLTADEITAILQCCSNSRNRAIFTMLYEGGFRISEVATLEWGMIKFDSYGVVVTVQKKTKKVRHIRLVMSKEALAKWKSDYPGDIEPEGLVFLNNRGEILNYQALAKILSELVKKAGIEKRVTLHLFRHSRITHLIQQGVNESVIKMMMWGTVDAHCFATYTHLAGMDVDREMLKLYNISEVVTEKPADKKLEPKICPNCQEINGPTAKYCPICGVPLDSDSIQDRDHFVRWLFDNPGIITEYLNNQKSQRGIR